MKKIIFGSFLCIASMVACHNNDTVDTKTTDSTTVAKDDNAQKFDSTDMKKDADFAVAVADAGTLEVKVSELAKTNAMAPAVKSLAEMMVTDHTKSGDELKGIAARDNITLPGALSADSQKAYDDLAAKKGADFDKAYMDQMEKDHKAAISKFQTEADKGMNADLKTFATNTLPTLNHHLDMVNATMKGMK
jgi:putative membrane protein